jgi:Flp pilus assembly protein TadG
MKQHESDRRVPTGTESANCQRRKRCGVGQAMVEFALVAIVGMFILVGAIQFALLGQVALALSQAAYQGARYAAVNPGFDQTAVSSYVKTVASPTILSDGGSDLKVTLNPGTARKFGDQVTVTLAYETASKLFLPNPFFGVSLPTSLTAPETAMSEAGS